MAAMVKVAMADRHSLQLSCLDRLYQINHKFLRILILQKQHIDGAYAMTTMRYTVFVTLVSLISFFATSGKASAADLTDPVVFNCNFYTSIYPDLSWMDCPTATAHWLNYGINEGRQGSVTFSSTWYLQTYPDLVAAYGATGYAAVTNHFLQYGINEGRSGSPVFSSSYYLRRHPDLVAAFGPTDYAAAINHFLQYGINEGRQGSPEFSSYEYLQTYPDLLAAFGATGYAAAVNHFLQYGINEGRQGIRVALGHNMFDLALQYQGHASGGDGSDSYLTVDQAMAKKRMFDAHNEGATFVRVSVVGYAPTIYNAVGDLALWQINPSAYWALMDQMMNDLDTYQLKIVPVFIWNWIQFPAMASEKVSDMLTNPNSKSYGLLTQYISDFVTRYRNRGTMAFYELTNELNLGADIDEVSYCNYQYPAYPEICAVYSNFTTDQMNTFAAGLAAYVKSLDPAHMIEPGYSIPRSASQHLRAQPQFSANGADWTADTPDQLRQYMTDTHQGFDMMSVHLYNGLTNGVADSERFGMTNPDDPSLLEMIKQIADGAGKPLFVGEYGDADSTSGHDSLFSAGVLAEIVKLRIQFSSPWISEFYQFNTTTPVGYNIEPGYTDSFIAMYEGINRALDNPTAIEPDTPQVVLTWPLAGAVLTASQKVYAVASTGGTDSIARVDFLIDGISKGSVTAPPYIMTLDTSGLSTGPHTLTAIAFSHVGTQAPYLVAVTK